MKVYNLTSKRSGETVRNQFDIRNNGISYFQSYNSLIAKWDGKSLVLGVDWDYSTTTSKYLHQWISENCYEIKSKLNNYSGSFKQKVQKAINNNEIIYDEGMR